MWNKLSFSRHYHTKTITYLKTASERVRVGILAGYNSVLYLKTKLI